MKKSSALLVVMILSFIVSIFVGQGLIEYVFEEEYLIAQTENDISDDETNTEDKEYEKGTNDNQNDNF